MSLFLPREKAYSENKMREELVGVGGGQKMQGGR